MPCGFLRLNGFEQFLSILRLARELFLLLAGGLGFLHAAKFLGSVFQPQVSVSVERDADIAVTHQVLQRLRIHACFCLIAAVGMAADVRSDAVGYVELTASDPADAIDDPFVRGRGLLTVLLFCAQLPDTLAMFKIGLLPFAQALHESDRTAEDYAAEFGKYFSEFPQFSLSDPSWMSLVNLSMQYLSTIMPGKDVPQLVRRMHYVSFVGMFRFDLFEGLSVGHAPRKCPICGRWFLTTDARHTKYCGGFAPGDPKGRTCRQLGNLQGREKRELADDHPLKVIYNRRMNTIQVYLRRGTLDEATAEKMKRLARNKLERAISDAAYANGSYADEMEQDALLREATS